MWRREKTRLKIGIRIRGISGLRRNLGNPAFTQKIPATVLGRTQKRLVEWQEKLAHTKKLRWTRLKRFLIVE